MYNIIDGLTKYKIVIWITAQRRRLEPAVPNKHLVFVEKEFQLRNEMKQKLHQKLDSWENVNIVSSPGRYQLSPPTLDIFTVADEGA